MNNFKAKKSLGQHFLRDKKALGQIIVAAELKPDEKVLEIGPGTGVLTDVLTDVLTSGKVIAVEKDERLANELGGKLQITNSKSQINSKFQIPTHFAKATRVKNSKFMMIKGDILEVNLPKLVEQNDFLDYKVVANIPYYITGRIIRLLFETEYPPKLAVLLVQKEVAERVCAHPGEKENENENPNREKRKGKKQNSGNYERRISRGKPGNMSILAVAVQYYGKPEIAGMVPKESFDPAPKVDSAILKITPFGNQRELKKSAKNFFRIVKLGFASRRKTLLNNLSAGLQIPKDEMAKTLRQNEIAPNVRAQDLRIEEWKRLQNIFFPKTK